MNLPNSTYLRNGNYYIERVLGCGGFGITYLATQVNLRRKVAIKEFFMKDLCNRDNDTSQVIVPSIGSRDMVDRFREKFIKEAQTIAQLNNEHIIRIFDIFEENGTAYYVMEYHSGGSLAELVNNKGCLSESEALIYIRQIADALGYLHSLNMNHLDVKPANVLLNNSGNAVLIDFGLAKHYDEEGKQTSTTPVGISHGYAPMEQYKKGGVGTFSPATDIYSLGATLYKLLTGVTPPEASDVYDDGLPPMNVKVSDSVHKAIVKSMNPSRKERVQSIKDFLNILNSNSSSNQQTSEETCIIDVEPQKRSETPIEKPTPQVISLCDALTLYNSGVYNKAFKMFQTIVEQTGNADAKLYLGLCYYNGQGVTKNYLTAFNWFKMAANEGSVDAQYQLGRCYLLGIAVKHNHSTGKMWLQKAARQGHIEAQKLLNKSGNGCLMTFIIVLLIIVGIFSVIGLLLAM